MLYIHNKEEKRQATGQVIVQDIKFYNISDNIHVVMHLYTPMFFLYTYKYTRKELKSSYSTCTTYTVNYLLHTFL